LAKENNNMPEKLEKLIKLVYRKSKAVQAKIGAVHPDEETLVCFLESRLSEKENEVIREHLLSCDSCAEAFSLSLKKGLEEKDVPAELLARVRNLLIAKEKSFLLEIVLRFKEKLLELINTTGDILVGQELMPAAVLRSRSIKDFKDEVIILKDFQDIRVEVRIENKEAKTFNLTITAKQKQTQKIIKDLRVTLLKDDLELESYLTDYGSVIFEHVLLGKYKVEISTIENKLASILIDIRV
jgi:hypothetical protein